MFNAKFIEELMKPQDLYSVSSLRGIFDRLAHSSIMRLSESSMDKVNHTSHTILSMHQQLTRKLAIWFDDYGGEISSSVQHVPSRTGWRNTQPPWFHSLYGGGPFFGRYGGHFSRSIQKSNLLAC